MTVEKLRMFIENVVAETRKEDLQKIKAANNSYTAIFQFIRKLGKSPQNFERVFRKENGYFSYIALGAILRREEHTKLYVKFVERTFSNKPETWGASAQLVGRSHYIEIYFSAPPEALQNANTYNNWLAANLERILNSSKIRSNYVHEFIHTLDFKRANKDYLFSRTVGDVGTPEYFNDPLELNAFFSQTISNIRNKLKKAQTKKEKIDLIGKTPHEFIDKFMNQYLNSSMQKNLTDANRQRLIKRAATSWELLKRI